MFLLSCAFVYNAGRYIEDGKLTDVNILYAELVAEVY